MRVAKALADLIESEAGGKAVALSGPYGSGKSTVINLLDGQLVSSETQATETSIFIFDAWSHRGDPLRRSFIEEFVEHLRDIGWGNPTQWQEKLDLLSKRKEITETTTEPKLTVWGGLVAITLLLMPLGFGLIRIASVQNPPDWSLPLGLLFSILPLVIVFVAYISWRPWRKSDWTDLPKSTLREKARSFLTENTRDQRGRSVFALFLKERHEEITEDTVRTPDLTSVEFKRHFTEILDSLTLGKKDRRLVIVVDNLDRLLSSEETIEAWSAMRAFFGPESRSGVRSNDYVWLVVPFAEEALSRAWPQTRKNGSEPAERNIAFSNDVLQDFIDKTFQVVLRVAPPVLSDWKDFLLSQLEEAFPGPAKRDSNFEKEAHRIYRLYQIRKVAGERPPTPRDIKAFINQISGLYRQWKDNLPLSILALYVLIQNQISPSAAELVESDSTLLQPATRNLMSEGDSSEENWRLQLAGVHFNVPTSRASEVLLGDRISTALLSEGEGDLANLVDAPGFYANAEREIAELVKRGDPHEIASAACTFGKIENSGSPAQQASWGEIVRAARRVNDWKPNEKWVGDGITRIIEHVDSSEQSAFAKHVLHAICRAKIEASPSDEENNLILPSSWVDAVMPVLSFLQDEGLDGVLQDALTIPGESKSVVRVFERLAAYENGEKLAPHFDFQVPTGEIISEYVRLS